MKKYISKSGYVDAVQFDGSNHKEIKEICKLKYIFTSVVVEALYGEIPLQVGDWVTKSEQGYIVVWSEQEFKVAFLCQGELKAQVVFMNDGPKYVVFSGKTRAEEKMVELKKLHFAQVHNAERITEKEYNDRFFWHTHEVEGEI